MISKNSKKIMLYLLRNFGLVNINQISRKLGISVGSAFKILKGFEEKEIVCPKNLGNAKYYYVNFDSEESIKLLELLLLEEKKIQKGYVKIYINEIQKFRNAELIILFGSVLGGKEFNDVDVLFVTNKPRKAVKFCLELSKIRSKPIVPLILKRADLIKEIKNEKDAVLEIIKKGIIIKGASIFVEVLKNAKI